MKWIHEHQTRFELAKKKHPPPANHMSPYCSHRQVIGSFTMGYIERDGEEPVSGTSVAPLASHLLCWNHLKQNTQNAMRASLQVQNKVKKKIFISLAFALCHWVSGKGDRELKPRHHPCNLLPRTGLGSLQQLLKSCRTQTLKGSKTAHRDVWMTSAKTAEGARAASFPSSGGQNGVKYCSLLLQTEVLLHPQWQQGYRGQHASINFWEQGRSQGTRWVLA